MIGLLWPQAARAFSLLGPFRPWQTPELGYNPLGEDIGGPQDLGEEFRWNVPIITYGFDQAFLDFFGDSGVAAVEEAIGVFNALPPCSQIDLNSFPTTTLRENYLASRLDLWDLKSAAMGMLIEQVGLTSPSRYAWTLRAREATEPGTNYTVVNRSFDPFTLEPSFEVNSVVLTYRILEFSPILAFRSFADSVELPVGLPVYPAAVADASGLFPADLSGGSYYFGLTRDDVGGICYLLSTNNWNAEELLSDVRGVDPSDLVRFAPRPGIDKLTFRRFPANGEAFVYQYWDTFLANGVPVRQLAERTVTKPDILFSVGDTGTTIDGFSPRKTKREATWLYEAARAGPGVIKPGIKLTFGLLGAENFVIHAANEYEMDGLVLFRWGLCDGGPTKLVVFPAGPAYQKPTTRQLTRNRVGRASDVVWTLTVPYPGDGYRVETSTDLERWTKVTDAAFPQCLFTFQFRTTNSIPQQFYRVVKN